MEKDLLKIVEGEESKISEKDIFLCRGCMITPGLAPLTEKSAKEFNNLLDKIEDRIYSNLKKDFPPPKQYK